jgi:hypothetical protein
MLVGSGELRGISGGERRRLSIALELINFPSILFAQQPTNGLDSANALMLVQYCRALAKTAQRSMIMSLVQPSPQLLLQFDKVFVFFFCSSLFSICFIHDDDIFSFFQVLLMSKGQIAYFGPSANILPHFLNLGYRLPPFKSWTEFLEEISGQPDLFFRPEQTIKEALSLEGITIQPADVVQHLPEAATKVT